ncbi:MAG: hypothetical protein IQL11_05845 [Bacteroidales bacterium]|nr:hypothetical protein [Bacteroidales bacterium]
MNQENNFRSTSKSKHLTRRNFSGITAAATAASTINPWSGKGNNCCTAPNNLMNYDY